MSFSKGEVNRAGKSVADYFRHTAGERQLTSEGVEQLGAAIDVIEWWRGEHARPLSRVAANLRYYAAKEGVPVVAQRLKRVPTIADKLVREPKMNLARMGDIGGVRAVLPNLDAAYRVAAQLRRNWTIARFSDYVSEPKPDGYRALHLINRHRGRLIEIQLRTSMQDVWANRVEGFSRSVAPGLKYGEGPSELREYFHALGEVYAAFDQGEPYPAETVTRVADLQRRVGRFIEEQTR
jgi:hypothetical protein